jgi:membrane-associated phospholipid phosphatase
MILLQSQQNLSLLEKILHADYWLMLRINKDWTSPWFDKIALFARESYLYVPFYLFLAMFMIMNFGKKGAWWVVTVLAMAGLNDLISSQVIKEIFDRPRPCRDPMMASQIRLIARYCGMNGSFISSHASNHFAAATFIFQTLKFLSSKWALVFIWAAIISYAQVYVGVHYPSDVICGAVFGIAMGYMASRFFETQIGLVNSHK